MSRIANTFAGLRQDARKALIPYITAGDPDLGETLAIMKAMVRGGADLIELGVPFSDPMADGPVIQRACERALEKGVRLTDVLDLVREFRSTDGDTPVVLMGYLNPIEIMGYQTFCEQAHAAGVDGVLIVDLPPEEAGDLSPHISANQLDLIFLLAPTTTLERAKLICSHGSGYLYYVSLKGVTGASNMVATDVSERLAELRTLTDLPIGVGFGIRDRESAVAIGKEADGVIIGSVLVQRIEAQARAGGDIAGELQDFLADIRDGLDSIGS